MAIRVFTLTILLCAVVCSALPASAQAEAAPTLDRRAVPAAEVLWARVADACAPGSVACWPCSPTAVSRDKLCCDFRNWDRCKWRFSATLGMYLAGMKGTIGIRGQEFDVNNSVEDSLNSFIDYGEAILQGGLSVGKGRWTLDFVFSGMRFGKGAKVGAAGLPLSNTLSLIQYQAKLYYRLAETKLGCKPCPMLLVWEPMIGFRGNSIELDVDGPFGLPGLSQSKTWLDPVVGARITWDLRNRWGFVVDGDVGGFGVASDLTWRVRATVGYRFSKLFSLHAGWVWIDTDYADGVGFDRFVWDVLQSGPVLAATFSF